MLAGDIYSPRQIRLIEVPEPTFPDGESDAAGQIVLQPELGCLCGSDVLYFDRTFPDFQPVVGHSLHELIGTIVETTGQRFRSGDRVLCVPNNQKGLCQRFVVSETQAIALDERATDEQAVLAQPLGTVICALRKLPSLLDADVAVVGQGPIGQLFCAALRTVGARRIIAIDRLAARLQHSPHMGATDVIDSSVQDPIEAITDLTAGALPDVVVEAVGHRDQAFNLCIELCRPGGRILAFGLTEMILDGLCWGRLHRKNLCVQTSIKPSFDRDFPLAMQWIGEGRIDVTPLITNRFGVSDIQLAFETFSQRRDGALKVFVDFEGVS